MPGFHHPALLVSLQLLPWLTQWAQIFSCSWESYGRTYQNQTHKTSHKQQIYFWSLHPALAAQPEGYKVQEEDELITQIRLLWMQR